MRYRTLGLVLLPLLGAASVLQADHSSRSERFATKLAPTEEVPSVSSVARGEFALKISRDGDSMDYSLSYRGLEGLVQQAHIHFGDKDVNGGISVWLCSNLASPPTPAGVQPCPTPPATIEGTILVDNVVGPAPQGIDTGDFEEIKKAIRGGLAYANVHSARFPGGEIRGQISRESDRDDD